MFGRGTLFLLLLAAAFFVPYLLSDPQTSNPLSAWWNSLWTDTVSDPSYAVAAPSSLPGSSAEGVSDWSQRSAAYTGRWDNHIVTTGSAGLTTGSQAMSGPPAAPMRPGEWRTVRTYPPGAQQFTGAGAHAAGSPIALTGPPVQSGTDLIRFDLTREWVMQSWQRVSTHLHEGDLDGMRVAMVSGTDLRDLAGSLTYYFNYEGQMQRLIFNGTTGDPNHLVQELSQRFGLQRDVSLGSNVFAKREKKQLTGWLRVTPAPIVRSSQPLQRYAVELELTRPGSQLPVSSRFVPRQSKTASDRRSAGRKP